jgi:hypothetical protein
LFRHLKSRRSSATPATLNALRLEANKNQQFSFVLNPNSGLMVANHLEASRAWDKMSIVD